MNSPENIASVDRVLVVGFGYAGRRFVAAIKYLTDVGFPIQLVGLCDVQVERMLGVPTECFTDLSEALNVVAPTVVCVTTNEGSHATVFEQLREHPRILVLSEKPLAASYAEAERASLALSEHCFSMNMVERFSPITTSCLEWLKAEGPFQVVRVESFWGKHRIRDSRPTMGVLTEIVHPLDLARLLFAPGTFDVLDGIATSSDFSCHAGSLLDSVNVILRSSDVPVVIHSSFVWTQRVRTVTAVLRSAREEMFRVELDFDNPKWDSDRLEVTSIGNDGHLTLVHRLVTDAMALPPEIRGVGKVVKFIDASVRAWRGNQLLWPPLAELTDAMELQLDLDHVARVMRRPLETAGYRVRECV